MERLKEPRIPLKTIGRILKHYINKEVSKETIVSVRDDVEIILKCLCEDLVKEVDESNKIRTKANLPIIKRITRSIFKSLSTQIFKRHSDLDTGNIGQDNRDTMLQSNASEVI